MLAELSKDGNSLSANIFLNLDLPLDPFENDGLMPMIRASRSESICGSLPNGSAIVSLLVSRLLVLVELAHAGARIALHDAVELSLLFPVHLVADDKAIALAADSHHPLPLRDIGRYRPHGQ